MKLKKTFSFFLALSLAFCSSLGLIAFAKEASFEKNCPTVHVIGFMSCPLYENPGTENQKQIWPPSNDAIIGAVKEALPALVSVSVTKDWKKFSDAVIPAANKIFEPVWLNESGENDSNTGIDFSYPTKEEVLSNDKFTFEYDWRLSPLELAEQLNDFIEYICKQSGSEKVCLTAHSYGGVISLSYISIFGSDRLQGVIFDSTAIFGETYTGELLTGKIKLSLDAIKSFLSFALDGTNYKTLVSTLTELLSRAGVLDFVINFADEMLEGIKDDAIPQVVMPLFCRWPTIWAMCPDEYLENAYNYVFGEVCKGDTATYAKLIQKLHAFDNTVRKNKVSILTETEKHCRFGVYSAYGYSAVPITPTWDANGDGVIDTKYTSFGATVAPVGKKLSDEYLSGKDEKYISPDKQVDASTCLFPEQTWFISGLKHSAGHDSLEELSNAILYSNEKVTVDTFEKYPRFLAFDHRSESVDENKGEENIFVRFFKAVAELFDAIKRLFLRIFGK